MRRFPPLCLWLAGVLVLLAGVEEFLGCIAEGLVTAWSSN